MAISTNDLTPGSKFLIRGKVAFSRIAKRVDGEELQRDIMRQKQQGRRIIHDRPYTSLSINDAKVIVRDPQNPTIEEQFAQEHLYESHAKGAVGYSYTGRNKSSILPTVLVMADDGHTAVPMDGPLGGELAPGLDVTIVMRVFKSAQNNGVSLDTVIVHDKLRYYNVGGLDLSEYGITVDMSSPVPAPAAPKIDTQSDPAPAPAPSPAPMQNPPPMTAAPIPQTAPAAVPVMPVYPSYDGNGQPASSPAPGISYDMHDRNY